MVVVVAVVVCGGVGGGVSVAVAGGSIGGGGGDGGFGGYITGFSGRTCRVGLVSLASRFLQGLRLMVSTDGHVCLVAKDATP